MPRIVLTSSIVAYNLMTLLKAQNSNFPASPREMNVQVPPAAQEAANAGATLLVGTPNSGTTPTDVTSPELYLSEGDSYLYRVASGVPASEKYLKGSVNNQVVYVTGA